MSEVEAKHPALALRPAWRSGIWIGALLLAIGVIAIAYGATSIDRALTNAPEHMSAPTPKSMRLLARSGIWNIAQGLFAIVIGGGMLTLSILKLHRLRAIEAQRDDWGSAAGP